MGRVLFGMIENVTRPIGGVKVIYQAVGGLRRRGIDAYVAASGGVPPWLEGSAAVEGVAILDVSRNQSLGADDLYVATDAIGPHRMPMLLRRPERRVLFIQNHNALVANATVDWSLLRHIRCLTVSEFSRRNLIDEAGFREVAVVQPGIDLSVFRPARQKRHRIAYMPRKRPHLAERLKARTRHAIEWLSIDGRSEAETAALLAESTIFLNLGKGEGFGLPALEAMAAGCVVCGFAGEGTTDFATAENGFWADEGDFEACERSIDAAVATFADPQAIVSRLQAGLSTAAKFALPVFEDRMATYIRSVL